MTRCHPQLTDDRRRHYLLVAKVFDPRVEKAKSERLAMKGQLKLQAVRHEVTPPPQFDYESASGGTRTFPKFDLDTLQDFTSFLQTVDGGAKSMKEAKEITTDVSKYLR